jgi:hypothetical protein
METARFHRKYRNLSMNIFQIFFRAITGHSVAVARLAFRAWRAGRFAGHYAKLQL